MWILRRQTGYRHSLFLIYQHKNCCCIVLVCNSSVSAMQLIGFNLALSLQVLVVKSLNLESFLWTVSDKKNNGFFLNGAEISFNSVISANSGNLINHWSMNWAQFKDPVFHRCLGIDVVVSWSLRHKVAGLHLLMTNIFCQWIQYFWTYLNMKLVGWTVQHQNNNMLNKTRNQRQETGLNRQEENKEMCVSVRFLVI